MHHFVHGHQVNDVLKESEEKVREDTDTVHVSEGEHCGELDCRSKSVTNLFNP